MKHFIFSTIVALIMGSIPLFAKDKVPGGYIPISEFKEAIDKSDGKKLIVLVVKGLNDNCPNCAEAMKNGERAVGSGVVKVFARAETLNNADLSSYPAELQERLKRKFSTGASVTFLVLDPTMEKLIAESSRAELQSNKKLTAEFKKAVQKAKKSLR